MVQESKYRVGIVGGGPAGCICAYFLQNNCDVTILEAVSPLKTLLPTGGGRCNLAHCEYDFKELAANYPRGEKFLYSIFSRFATAETLDFFHNIGVETYVQDDRRIFPTSNSSVDVRDKFLKAISHTNIINEKVLRVNKNNNVFNVVTDSASYDFDAVVISIGGHSSYNMCKYLGHNIIEPRKALVGLQTKEDLSELAGVSITLAQGDLLFTHKGISGPYAYKLSSIKARDSFPYSIKLNFVKDLDLQQMLNDNPHKSIKNILSEVVPKSFAVYLLHMLNINMETKAHQINGKLRDKILEGLNNFDLTITGTASGSEVVTCGGVDLKEVNAATMESKIVTNLYFAGEVLDIDGFCGGFNLQNCWSTGYVAAQAILCKAVC